MTFSIFDFGFSIVERGIEVNPNIHFGKPCIAGTRITVQDVIELLRAGVATEAIIRDYYPDLRPDDVQACINRKSKTENRK